MSPAEARQRADQILWSLAEDGDPESTHADQDQFYVDVLRIIAEHSTDPYTRQHAVQALRVADGPGTRWYA